MAKNTNPRAKKLAQLEHGVRNNPLLKHMRHMAYNVYGGFRAAVSTGSDSDSLKAAEEKRLRKQQKRSGSSK